MKTLPMKGPIAGTELITAAVGCVNRLVEAYETSKRIELERERLECQHDLDKRKLTIMECELARKHKQALKVLEMRDKELSSKLALIERNFGVYEREMALLCDQSKMAMERVCKGDAKDREFFLGLWLKVHEYGSRKMALECEDLSKGMLEYNRQVACLIDGTKHLGSTCRLALSNEEAS